MIIVNFSTSNLTPQTSAEASWCDFFPLRNDNNKDVDVNDFGLHLMDFITKVNLSFLKMPLI